MVTQRSPDIALCCPALQLELVNRFVQLRLLGGRRLSSTQGRAQLVVQLPCLPREHLFLLAHHVYLALGEKKIVSEILCECLIDDGTQSSLRY